MVKFFASLPILSALLAILTSACAPTDNSPQQTLVAQNNIWSTQIADIRATATVESDRLSMTAEAAQTQLAGATVRNAELADQLVEMGVDPTNLANSGAGVVFQPTPQGARAGETAPLMSAADPAVMTAVTPTPLVVQAPLYEVVTSMGVGSDDCAVNVTSQFTTADTQIYVVARANVTAGTQLVSRWLHEGTDVVSYDWTPDFDVTGNCIWFYIDQNDTQFLPGAWVIELSAAGVPVTSVQFTISG
jgi:hypothetical protein